MWSVLENFRTRFVERSNEMNFSKSTLFIKFGILCFVMIGVWILFSIPVIFYHLQPETAANVSNFLPANYVASTHNCSQSFILNEETGFCYPVCGEWKEFSDDQVTAFATITSLLYFFHIIGTVIALSFSFYNYKVMFKFPAILLVYYLVSPIILDVTFVIRLLGRDNLLCSSTDLLHTLQHSTNFCYFSGIINTFIFTLYSYWWLFLAINIFWKVWFPVNAKYIQARGCTKFIHIAIILLSLIISIIPVGAALGTGGFVISSFPSFLNYCYPRNPDTLFYSFILPFCIVLPSGSTFNLLTFWKVLRVRKHLLKQGSSNLRAESKLLIFFFYFAFANALSLIFFTIGSRDVSQNQEGFSQYFTCEALGEDPDDPCVFTVNRQGQQAFTIASFVMYTMGPYATLVYVVPVDKVKKNWGIWKNKSTHVSTS